MTWSICQEKNSAVPGSKKTAKRQATLYRSLDDIKRGFCTERNFLSFFYNLHGRICPKFLKYADNRIISRSPRGGDYDESGFSRVSNSISMDEKPVPVLVSLGLVTH